MNFNGESTKDGTRMLSLIPFALSLVPGRDSLCLEAKYRTVFSIPLDDQMTVELLEHGFTFRQTVVVLEGLYK